VRVLITGAAGFLGYHCTRALLEGSHELALVDDLSRHGRDAAFTTLLERPAVKFYELNLCAERSWDVLNEHFDVVVHLAAINGTRHFYERPYDVLDTNVELLRRLLAWHRRSSPEARIVWTSSSEVYGGMPGVRLPTDEATPVGIDDVFNPRYSYAVSKLAGELLLISYGRQHGARFTIIRPHNVYGPRMGHDHVVPEFIGRLLRREDPFRIHGGETTRAFCHVDDFTRGLVGAVTSPAADGQVVNLGDDRHEITIRDLADRLFRIAGHTPRVEILPGPAGGPARRCPALDKARTLLDYRPRVGLDDGLRRTFEWYASA
jgi:UDP-glucose 4-epimerase/UDP-glucuronate decarboxylase